MTSAARQAIKYMYQGLARVIFLIAKVIICTEARFGMNILELRLG